MFRLFLLTSFFLSQFVSAASISPRTFNALNDIQQEISQQPDTDQVNDLNERLTEMTEDLAGNSLGLALAYQTHAQL